MKTTMQILRELREDKDMNQSEVAQYIGTTQQHYSKYETGVYELPLRYFSKLAELYDVSADYLLGRTEHTKGRSYQAVRVTKECSCEQLLDKVLSLSDAGRRAAIEYIELLQMKEGNL